MAAQKKFNIVDIVIVALVLLVLAGGTYKYMFQRPEAAGPQKTIEYVLMFEGVRQPTIDAVTDELQIRHKDGTVLGNVLNKEVKPLVEAVPTADGKLVEATVPGKYSMLLTLRSPATVTDTTIMIGTKEILVGTEVPVRSKTFQSTGVVFNVKELD